MEKAILITVDLKDERGWSASDRAAELRELARSCGCSVEAEVICHRDKPTADLFIGKGKFDEVCIIARKKKADLVVFNNDLTATQLRNVERGLEGVRVIDRTQMILDVFALHAKSMEGKLQVELAQLEYLLPRLTGRGIELSRLGGGIGTRGPGEKILEYDRRKIRNKISRLKKELEELIQRRGSLRKKRKDAALTTIAIIGYTNTGKTTLLNKLTNSKKLVQDKLFTTLDPVARVYTLPNNLKVLFHDTVGFLYDLPHHLVESFRSTLEEVKMADILIHVLDASNPRVRELDTAVYDVLRQLGSEDKPTINALNKIDLIENKKLLRRIKMDYEDVVCVSALKGDGIEELVEKAVQMLSHLVVPIKVDIPIGMMYKLNLIYESGKVLKREDRNGSVYIEAIVPVRIKHKIETY